MVLHMSCDTASALRERLTPIPAPGGGKKEHFPAYWLHLGIGTAGARHGASSVMIPPRARSRKAGYEMGAAVSQALGRTPGGVPVEKPLFPSTAQKPSSAATSGLQEGVG